MERLGFLKEPPHIIQARLRLAEIAERLAEVAVCRKKAYSQIEPLLEQERELIQQITEAGNSLKELLRAESAIGEDR